MVDVGLFSLWMGYVIPRERESKVQRSIIVRLSRLGIKLWRRNVAAFEIENRFIRCGSPGQADLWGIDRTARHWEIEAKRLGNKPTAAQLIWLKDMSARGCVAFWADNANTAEVVAEAILAGGQITWREGVDFDVT